jgi:hypothetical protein
MDLLAAKMPLHERIKGARVRQSFYLEHFIRLRHRARILESKPKQKHSFESGQPVGLPAPVLLGVHLCTVRRSKRIEA